MRTPTLALASLLTLAAAARADDVATAAQRAVATHQTSLVRVEVTTHVAVRGLPGVAPGTRRTQRVSTVRSPAR